MTLTPRCDQRFSEPGACAPAWSDVSALLAAAELYWITTVRPDGSPHVTPLVGTWHDESFVFCTGPAEQKALNLESNRAVAITTGVNTWNDGHDVVVEGPRSALSTPPHCNSSRVPTSKSTAKNGHSHRVRADSGKATNSRWCTGWCRRRFSPSPSARTLRRATSARAVRWGV